MAERVSSRVEGALHGLLVSLTPPQLPDEDDESYQARCEYTQQKGRRLLQDARPVPTEINQSQDLIRRKLLREHASPEKAARFGNLYQRLLTSPVLNQKWSILYLLLGLSEPTEDQVADILEEWDRESEDVASSVASLASPVKQSEARSQQPRSEPQEDIEDEKQYTVEPSESSLLQDLPFNLQGLSSAHLKFEGSAIKLPPTLPIPILGLLHSLAEPCLLYRDLLGFTESADGGLIGQSLRAATSVELRAYLSLIGTLEGEIRRGLAEPGRKSTISLKRCVIWTRDATMALRLMAAIAEKSGKLRGGQLISLVHGYASSHGDPFVSAFAEKLLGSVTRPFYDMLRRWIYDGELVDPYHEFFVSEIDPSTRADVDARRVETSVWEDKYSLDLGMMPSIIGRDFAKKIFLSGKSLNFLRHNCGDADWVMDHSKSASLLQNDTALEASIDEAYKTTMTRLTHLMSTKYHLFTHLAAIKQYLLLSQGDFIALLMESLAPHLDRPAYSQYRHTLTSQLEHAIRHSNAQYSDPEVLRRLDARMVELGSGEIGWDSFTLEYKISPPCDVVITQWASVQYLKVFNLLWRIKRVEFSLSTVWRRCSTGARGVLSSVEDKVGSDWKRARCVIAEMVHFVNQLQYYVLFEVIEASWDQLQAAMNKPDSTLDDLIDAHKKYINAITHKGLLGPSMTGQREDSFLSQLHYILKCMLAYKDVVDELYSHSVAEFLRRQQFRGEVDQRTAQGRWGVSEQDPPELLPVDDKPTDNQLTSLRARLLDLAAEFKSRVNVLLYDLAHQPDVDMRFLGVVMNFNEVYKPVRRKRDRKRGEKSREQETRNT